MSGWREIVDNALRGVPAAVEPYEAAPLPPMPLTEGLAAFQAMTMPAIASPDRWGQVQADAAALIADWSGVLHLLGWSVADVFGLDPAVRQGDMGLAYAIRGGRVVLVEEGSAMIRDPDGLAPDGGARLHYRTHFRAPDPPEPIWLCASKRRRDRDRY